MKKTLIFLSTLLLALSARAMTPLTEFDLSNVSNPLSLSINPEQRIMINNKPDRWDDSDGLNQLLPTSSGLMIHFNMNLFEDMDETAERYTPNKRFSSFTLLSGNNDVFNKVQIFLIDPVTGKNYTALSSDDAIFNKYQIFPIKLITWKNYTAIINAQTVNAEDTNGNNINTQATTPSITHSNNDTSSSNSPYRYNIVSGNTDMRDTYINKTNRTIQSGSWVDIKTR